MWSRGHWRSDGHLLWLRSRVYAYPKIGGSPLLTATPAAGESNLIAAEQALLRDCCHEISSPVKDPSDR
jgi:hypothetical protein